MSCRHQDHSPQLKSPRPLPRVRQIPDQDDRDRCQMTNWWLLRLFHWQHQSMPVSTWRVASDVGLSTGVNNPQPTTGVNSATLPSLATCHRKPNIRARVPAIDTSLRQSHSSTFVDALASSEYRIESRLRRCNNCLLKADGAPTGFTAGMAYSCVRCFHIGSYGFVRVARGRDAVQTAARHLQELLRQGHTYMDRDGDGEACERNR